MDTALKANAADTKGKEPAGPSQEEPSDEWIVTSGKESQAIRDSLRTVQELVAKLPTGSVHTVRNLK